ncbi:peptide deformylase [Reichenbachiella agariperforans]|uniref:peptide deformylase n=1 Tax=Reichenbachiella agariperforans TaxID=156994 RepID=UPI001C08C415|nr:peptide deformylase [Reichenbachiella agariperforans]MBU2915682.1 peptide deformylase [Reichenbachiella agariperforans]
MKKSIYLSFVILLLLGSCTGVKQATTYHSSQFSDQQEALILSGDGRQPMRIFKITDRSDSLLLRSQSEPVTVDASDTVLVRLVDRMFATMRDSLSMGVGIAAPQVGILKNIIWVQRLDKEDFPFEAYLNPEIIYYSDLKQDCREGCLSIPDRMDTTKTRSYAIEVTYDKLDQKHYREKVEGFTAVIFQHEIDHLQGILYLDHLTEEVEQAK